MSSFGGFELLGGDSDETRVLVHAGHGYAVAVPGHPRASQGSTMVPTSDVVVTMTDKPVELAWRVDTLSTVLEPEPLAISLAAAYASARSLLAPELNPLRAPNVLAPGAAAGASAIYERRDQPAGSMEHLSVTIRKHSSGVLALYRAIRYSTNDVTPMQWPNIRAAISCSQSWDGRAVTTPALWPSSELARPSVALEFTDAAWSEAQAKAAAIVEPLSEDDTTNLVHAMVDLARNDDPPTLALHPYIIELTARQLAMRIPTPLAHVLLRNIDQIKTTHDLRAWAWQCVWAVGNRPMR